ncbi:hypothetical protein NFI95_05880 [Acetobacteraceae bacterium KSS8]|uniref:Uncharacterized protein n=1 Tax=Endosaccharibacter trunci TaxID=2812733 RepID=A0ABT1W544_9PROT|nr:hypothetical protein [Acetobacteraceae bacterium KSS8]
MLADILSSSENVAYARRCDPHIWALDLPDASCAAHQEQSLIRAASRRGLIWWNPVSEHYEPIKREDRADA